MVEERPESRAALPVKVFLRHGAKMERSPMQGAPETFPFLSLILMALQQKLPVRRSVRSAIRGATGKVPPGHLITGILSVIAGAIVRICQGLNLEQAMAFALILLGFFCLKFLKPLQVGFVSLCLKFLYYLLQ